MLEQIRFDLKKNLRGSTNVVVFAMLLILMLGTFFTALGTKDSSEAGMYNAYTTAGQNIQKTLDTLQKVKHLTANQKEQLARKQTQHDYLQAITMAYAGTMSAMPTGSFEDVNKAVLAYATYNLKETKAGRASDLSLVTYDGKALDATLLGRKKEVALYTYLVQHHVKEIPVSKTDAPGAAYLSYTFLYHLSPLILLAVVGVLIGQLFTNEKRDGTIAFMNTLPTGKVKILTARMVTALVLTLPIFGLACFMTYLITGLKFGWGSWAYPIIYSADGKTVAEMSLGHFLGLYLLLFAVATVFLVVVSALIGLITANFGVNLVGLGAVILVATQQVLGQGILKVVAPFLPSSYFDFSNLILHQTTWPILSINAGILVILGWSALIYGICVIILRKREQL